jgi:hypothetical protein
MIHVDHADIAWAAGVFEGEGTVVVQWSTRSPRQYVQLVVAMTDEDVVREFARVVGVGSVNGPRANGKLGRKPIWKWSAAGTKAEAVLALPGFADRLGARRSERIAQCRAAAAGACA